LDRLLHSFLELAYFRFESGEQVRLYNKLGGLDIYRVVEVAVGLHLERILLYIVELDGSG